MDIWGLFMTGAFMKQNLAASIIAITVIATGLTLFCDAGFCEHKNSTYTLKPGEEFTIELKSNPSTGYSWEMSGTPDKNVAVFVQKEYAHSDSGLVGAPGAEHWSFRAVGSGRTTIYFRYVRPWEKSEKPANSASYEVVVK
jgi:inhibitor of cysteine peptidase